MDTSDSIGIPTSSRYSNPKLRISVTLRASGSAVALMHFERDTFGLPNVAEVLSEVMPALAKFVPVQGAAIEVTISVERDGTER